jgi:serine O-acetyltransferase
MIQSRQDYLHYIREDNRAGNHKKPSSLSQLIWYFNSPTRSIWEFKKTLRKLEYCTNCKKGAFAKVERFFLRRKFQKLSYKLGYSIPINVFGPGLALPHYGTIIINKAARIGANCRMHCSVNIGAAPVLGNDCYIGPGVKIYGEITIADNVAIGANAVVNKSFTESNITIAGVPAKKISLRKFQNP